MRRGPAAAFTSLAAALLFLAPARAAAAEEAPRDGGGIVFVMPAADAFVAGGPVIVAGRLPPGDSFVNLLLDGSPVGEVVREGRTFQATLQPSPGRHEVEARAGELSAKLVFSYGTGGRGEPPYRFHRPVVEGRCTECHAGMRPAVPGAEARTCKSCHRKLAVIYPYVHGPLAAGKCLVCHDPHGSSWPSLTLADAKTMCTACHDQPGSLLHVEQARSRVCYLCHNPHASMNRKFLYDIVK